MMQELQGSLTGPGRQSVPDALMLFAAGLGRRMGELTRERPKPLIKVAGKALIDHAFDLIDAAGIARVTVNLHHLPDLLRGHLADRGNLAFSDETETLLETGGGLRKALPQLGGGAVFTLNTDAVWTGRNALKELAEAWDPTRMAGLLSIVPREVAEAHPGKGDFDMAPDGRLTRGRDFVYTGAQILKTDDLAGVEDTAFSLNRVWDMMLDRGELFGAPHDGGWCDVGHPAALPIAEAMLAKATDV